MQALEVPEPPQACAFGAGKDQMIEHPAVEGAGSCRKPPGRTEVRLARARIAARMVVGEQDGGASVPCRIDDDLPERESEVACAAEVP